MLKNLSISVIIPCFNEEKGIAKVLSDTPRYIDEIIVVDNNSTDQTAKIAKKLGAEVIKEKKQGYGAAIKTGLYSGTKDLLVVLDGDDTYSFNEIKDLVIYLEDKKLDFVSANRFDKRYKNTMPVLNLIGNKVLTLTTQILFSYNLKDSQSGMFCFRRSILPKLNLDSSGMSFSEEIKIEALKNNSIRFSEYPITYHDDKRLGQKKNKMWKDGLNNLIFLFKKRLIQFSS